MINLSLGGALLDFLNVVPEPSVRAGQRVQVNIRCRGGSGPISLEGTAVLWHSKADTAPLLAIQFDEVTGEDQEILEDLIAEALAELQGRGPVLPIT